MSYFNLYAVSLLIIIGQVEELESKTRPQAPNNLLVQASQPNLALSEAQMARPVMLTWR